LTKKDGWRWRKGKLELRIENCSSRGQGGLLYQFFKDKYRGERQFYDLIPPLLEKKYLKTIINCHKCAHTLDRGDLDGDGAMTVLDMNFILRQM
jgi:hypothetical protein